MGVLESAESISQQPSGYTHNAAKSSGHSHQSTAPLVLGSGVHHHQHYCQSCLNDGKIPLSILEMALDVAPSHPKLTGKTRKLNQHSGVGKPRVRL